MIEPPEEMQNFEVTCRVTGCVNEDSTIPIIATATNPFIVCGPCGVQITDIVKIEP